MIDEVQTGGGPTGKMWAFEHFDLPEAPDIVSFRYSRKRQLRIATESCHKTPLQNVWCALDVGLL